MALRSRSRTATATSGPGRDPASDGRARHRRPPSPRGRVRQGHRHGHRDRHAPAEELRRRAQALFGEDGDSDGAGDGAGGSGRAGRVPSWAVDRATAVDLPPVRSRGGAAAGGDAADAANRGSPGGVPDPVDPGDQVSPVSGEGRYRERFGLALRERLPLWVQTRCGLERRSVVALSVLLVVAVGFAVQHFWSGRTQPVRAPEVVRAAAPHGERGEGEAGREEGGPGAPAGAVEAGGPAGPGIVVDVSGKVRDPGIHRLPAGSRVEDALRAAGGVRPGTKTDGLNRARFLVDGEQVVVGGPAPVAGPDTGGGTAASGGAAGAPAGTGPAAPVSLSTATPDQLDALPGVGPVLARHIVDYRTRHGGFRSVDELREVDGIGDRRFEDLRDLVRP
ncbi:ComEA family DNA-binding protein [Streptomyces sp. Tu 3180]|uniref:ComEA family DNA-binding protein n=1 Tax=Streptomyces sp. Tu 3180 TaxID=2682611 RepID=UPI00135BBF9B|nr:ComEA family DNA-binding protein [Streptomyces sp. Tu 3180]